MVVQYGSKLMKYDRQHTIRLYEAMIDQGALNAINRREYAYVCDGILALYQAGGQTEALQKVEQLQRSNSRRPAFLDELNDVQKAMK